MDFQSLLNRAAPAPPPPVMPADPGLPSDLLPPNLESWIRDTATITGVPPVMIALPYLAGTGAVIGNRLGLQLKLGWTEYPSLWIALVTLTGGGKTPALLAARQPFNVLHQELLAASRASGDPDTPLIITRGTWHQLQHILPHANGLLLHRDELLGLLRSIDRGTGETRQHYLSLWSGDVVDEATHDIIDQPVVSIVGGIQPLLLFNFRRKQHDGLMERFLPVVAGAPTTNWRHDTPDVPDLAHALNPLRTLRHRSSRTIVPFSAPGAALWSTWYDAQCALTGGASLAMHGFHRKYPLHLARLILVFHALWNADDPALPVSRDTVDRAITLIEYLRVQMHRSLVLVNQKHPLRTPAESLIDRIAAVLTDHRAGDGWLQRSRIARKLGDPASALLTIALNDLLTAERIERREVQGPRGRPAEEFRLRPKTPVGGIGVNPGQSDPKKPMDSTDSALSQLSGLMDSFLDTIAANPSPEDTPHAPA